MKDSIEIGDAVSHSPVGAGTITGFTERGFPQVNHVAVAWLRLPTGEEWNPFSHDIASLIEKGEGGATNSDN